MFPADNAFQLIDVFDNPKTHSKSFYSEVELSLLTSARKSPYEALTNACMCFTVDKILS